MIDPNDVPRVADDEILARFVLQRSHFRSGDLSIKPDAFMPPPDLELSVTRHLSTTGDELWVIGEDVALQTSKSLYGRGDVGTLICRQLGLDTLPAPLPTNPNHGARLRLAYRKVCEKERRTGNRCESHICAKV